LLAGRFVFQGKEDVVGKMVGGKRAASQPRSLSA